MKSIALVVAALATAITLTLTSCANWSEQEALIAQLPPGQRAQAELQLARDKQAARMQAAMAISAAAAQATAPGTALNPYQVEVRHYNYPAYRYPYYRSYYNY